MAQDSSSRLAHVVIVSFGCMLIALGTLTALHPEIMTRYGLSADNAHASSTIMAVIGGGEIGLGLFALLGKSIGVTLQARIYLLLFVFSGVLVARIMGGIRYYSELPNVFFWELLAELLLTSVVAGTLYVQKRVSN
jgi:hypothetical protein